LEDGDGPNLYCYVHNNPLYYTDPDGRFIAPLVIPLFTFTWGAAETAFVWMTAEAVGYAVAGAVATVMVTRAVYEVDAWQNNYRYHNSVEEPPYKGDQLGADLAECPQEGFEWRGRGEPITGRGSWYNQDTNESLHPDFSHPPPVKPHWDYQSASGREARLYLDGSWEWKGIN
jgi:hypothetical protein